MPNPLRTLSLLETRVLGTLVEKQHTVPDAYPLTLNALVSGCNQKTSRSPVMEATDTEVQGALDSLKAANLVIESSGGRVARYSHNFERVLQLPSQSAAILTSLMLRGPQTAGELRSRTERLHPFASQEEVDETLRQLAGRNEPLVARLERRPGQKESRWAHLLGADLAEILATDDDDDDEPSADGRPPRIDRVAALEDAVAGLRADLERLQRAHRDLVARLGETEPEEA